MARDACSAAPGLPATAAAILVAALMVVPVAVVKVVEVATPMPLKGCCGGIVDVGDVDEEAEESHWERDSVTADLVIVLVVAVVTDCVTPALALLRARVALRVTVPCDEVFVIECEGDRIDSLVDGRVVWRLRDTEAGELDSVSDVVAVTVRGGALSVLVG